MDEKIRQDIRQSARILHWVTQVVLAGAFAYTLYGGFQLVYSHFIFRNRVLMSTHHTLLQAKVLDLAQRRERLLLLPPPADSAQWAGWAEAMREIMDFR